MKFIITTLFFSFSLFLKAQVFLEISNGYSFPLQKSELAFPYFNGSYDTYLCKDPIYNPNTGLNYFYFDHTITKKRPAKMNFGTGYNFSGSLGYYFGKYLGLSLTYIHNNTTNDFNEKKTYYALTDNDYYGNPLVKNELEFTFYAISNSIVLQSIIQYPINKYLNPFIKLGVSRSTHEIFVSRIHTFTFNNYNDSDGNIEKYYGNYSLGYIFSLGTKYNIKNFAFSFECRFLLDKYSPPNCFSYSYFHKYSNGTYDNSVPIDHELVLEDYSNGGNYRNNPSIPYLTETRYKSTFSFSTFSINIGIQYTLRFKKK